MAARQSEFPDSPERSRRPRCAWCGDVIGIYEPIVVEGAGARRVTSLAAEPELLASPLAKLHRDCWEARGQDAIGGQEPRPRRLRPA